MGRQPLSSELPEPAFDLRGGRRAHIDVAVAGGVRDDAPRPARIAVAGIAGLRCRLVRPRSRCPAIHAVNVERLARDLTAVAAELRPWLEFADEKRRLQIRDAGV